MSPNSVDGQDPPPTSPKKMKTSSDAPQSAIGTLLVELREALQLELKYQGGEQPKYPVPNAGTITSGMRDGSAHVLRCLKVWYDLPSDIFFNSVSIMDRFLSKMKAQPKHVSCIAVSAFHLACLEYEQLQEARAKSSNQVQVQEPNPSPPATMTPSTHGAPIAIPEPSDLVTISQSRCSSSDLLRMQGILVNKLAMKNPGAGPEEPVTALSLLRSLYAVSRHTSVRLGFQDILPECLPDYLPYQLEILTCNSRTLKYRPAEVALGLLTIDFRDRAIEQPQCHRLMVELISEMQRYCNIGDQPFDTCLSLVGTILENYNGEGTVQHRQRLVWKLSHRTLKHLRPTEKLRATLPTIDEQGSKNNLPRLRSTSECSDQSMVSLSESDSERDSMEEVGAN